MEILIIIILILLNGIFSMSEISLVSSRKFKLENAAKKGNNNARKALELVNNPTTLISTSQIGITVVSLLTGIYSGETFAHYFEAWIAGIPALKHYAHTISVSVVVVIITFATILFGELLPKRIGLIYPETIAIAAAGPMLLLSKITAPFIWLLTRTNDLFLRLFRIKHDTSDAMVSEEEIKAIIQESSEGGEIQAIEKNIVDRVFDLGDRRVSELMTHRSEVVWFNINDDLDTVRRKIAQQIHSMYPVCDGQIDKLRGVIILKELFTKDVKPETFHLDNYLKKPLVVHDNTAVYRLMEQFREQKFHYAMVVDEYGTVQGIITMDDLLDALIGDMSDYDQDEYQITERNEHSWLADAQYPYFEMCNYFNVSPVNEDTAGDFNTIGGLILNRLGRVPAIGDKIRWETYEIEVVDMDGLRIDKVMITQIEKEG